MKSKDERWAVFWCGLLEPLLYGEVDRKDQNRFLNDLSRQEFVFPDGTCRKPSLSTLKRKLGAYRKGGFGSLQRKPRNDRGKPRAVSQEIIDKAIELKREQPRRSEETINNFLESLYGVRIPKSTLYKYLKEAGATKLKLGITKKKVRCRWTRDHTHDLWQGDFEHGPYALVGDEVVPTHLSAFIDCHSRFCIEARYYLKENLDILIDSLLRAWAVHGASAELYLDNAKVYCANGLKAACYAVGTKLLHRPPRDPSPGGLVERLFETIQSQFEAEIRAGDILPLEELNRALSAYLAVSYHQRKHSETGQTPKERYEKGLTVIRHVDMTEIITFFMTKVIRTVHRDFSDVQIDHRYYKVDPKLRGDKVEVRYDPFSTRETVLIYSLREQYLCKGMRHDREKAETQEQAPATQAKPAHNYIDLLVRQHEEMLKVESRGIDYRAVVRRRAWSFTSFATALVGLLGRTGGLGAFSAMELELLKKTYNRGAALTRQMLEQACEMASEKTFLAVLYELRVLIDRKGR